MAEDQAAPRQFEAGARVRVFEGCTVQSGQTWHTTRKITGVSYVSVKLDGRAYAPLELASNVYQLPRDRAAFVARCEAVIAYMQGQIEEVGNE